MVMMALKNVRNPGNLKTVLINTPCTQRVHGVHNPHTLYKPRYSNCTWRFVTLSILMWDVSHDTAHRMFEVCLVRCCIINIIEFSFNFCLGKCTGNTVGLTIQIILSLYPCIALQRKTWCANISHCTHCAHK